jgi:hypothetical protein
MEANGSSEGTNKGKTWVQFSEENETENSQNVPDNDANITPAVIETSIEIHSPLGANKSLSSSSPPGNKVHSGNLQNVELHNSLENNVNAGSTGNVQAQGSTSVRGTANGNRRNASGFSMQ